MNFVEVMSGFFAFVAIRRNWRCASNARETAVAYNAHIVSYAPICGIENALHERTCSAMTPPKPRLRSVHAFTSPLSNVSKSSMDWGKSSCGASFWPDGGCGRGPDGGGAVGAPVVPLVTGSVSAEEAMSSKRLVAASSLEISCVSAESLTCTGAGVLWLMASLMVADSEKGYVVAAQWKGKKRTIWRIAHRLISVVKLFILLVPSAIAACICGDELQLRGFDARDARECPTSTRSPCGSAEDPY